jgi:23S rRNA (uridine2552-2'-O)-methyltransferase
MARGKRSRSWLQRHSNDYYVRQAREQGWRSRAVYKLKEIDARDHLLKAGMTVVDLGSAPGGWSQYAAQRVGRQGRVIAMDMLEMAPILNVEFVQGDFREKAGLRQLIEQLGAGGRADLVISDAAPNITGMPAVDQPQVMDLAELSLQVAREVLGPSGCFVVKLFQGQDFDRYVLAVRACFDKAAVRKPAASRPNSREVYVVAKYYRL